jgi:N-acetylglucosamine kinase-like BadF-type ATPase
VNYPGYAGIKAEMAGYYLGVDLGGTKSHALIADEQGRALALGKAGPGNHEVVGYEEMARVLGDITDQALSMAGINRKTLRAAGFGIAGYDWPGELEAMQAAVGTLDLGCPYELVNDALIGLLAGAEAGWGVAVVAGTGCNCWGRDEQHCYGHVTGYGPAMAEGVGAGDLVARAVQAVSLAWSRRGKPTAITQAMIDLCGARDPDDLIEGLCTFRYFVDAPFAPRIFQLAEEGDEVAGDLIRWAGEQLGSLAVGVIRQLGFEERAFDVVLAGRLFDGGICLIEPLSAVIQAQAPDARFVRLEAPPVVGGVLLGMDQVGGWLPGSRERVIATTRLIIQNSGG